MCIVLELEVKMKGFLDKLQNNKSKKDFKNPFAPKKNQNRGGGKSLGGTKPGKILSITIPSPGPIGVVLENTKEGSAIVASVADGSQAEAVGLQRGDVICFQDTNGMDEIDYRLFLDMTKSAARPLTFDIRRIESSAGKSSLLGSNPNIGGGTRPIRADAEARRQAVIAAAESRDKQHKHKNKPMRKYLDLSAEQKKKIQQQKEELALKNATYMSNTPLTDEAQKAVEAARQDEVKHAAKLGYNPYESMKGTGQQGSTAVTDLNHGTMQADAASGTKAGKADEKASNSTSSSLQMQPIDPAFDDAFTTLLTTNNDLDSVAKSLRIMRKLIQNATAEGQSEEKRRVRISNPNKHIDAAINQTEGALDLMMSVGFIIADHHEDSETYLMHQYEDKPGWLTKALDQMEQYENNFFN